MLRFFLPTILLLYAHISQSQSLDLGLMAGGSNYIGELQDQRYNLSQMHLAVGGSLTYHFSPQIALRGEVWKGNLSGADAHSNNPSSRSRNLSFNTRVYEASVVGIYRFLSPELQRISPYIYGGVASFRINPYTNDAAGEKFFLFPLSTEGQGLPQYPDRKAHKFFHMAIPFGGGVQMEINDKWSIGFEMGLRITFTDYIDDVSAGYIDPVVLQQERGAKAVELSYRGDELPGGSQQYPRAGILRGNSAANDWYYNTVFRLHYKIAGQSYMGKKRLGQTGCPSVW